jgi:hypothetical protein
MLTKCKLIIVFSIVLFLSACGNISASNDQLVETFSPVCDGQPVEVSSDYQPNEPGLHPILVIGMDKMSEMLLEDYFKEIPDLNGKWKPREAAATQLVACGSSSSHETGTCNYSGMIRQSYDSSFSISLYSAKDGTLIDRREWTCDGQCPNPLTDENADQLCYTAAPDAYKIEDWLPVYIITPEWQESGVQFNGQIAFPLRDYNLREIALLDSKGITFLTSNI